VRQAVRQRSAGNRKARRKLTIAQRLRARFKIRGAPILLLVLVLFLEILGKAEDEEEASD